MGGSIQLISRYCVRYLSEERPHSALGESSPDDSIEKATRSASGWIVGTFEDELRLFAGLLNRQRGTKARKTAPCWAPRKSNPLLTRRNAEPVKKKVIMDIHSRGRRT